MTEATTNTRTDAAVVRVDQAHEAGDDFVTLGRVIATDLLDVPIGITPPRYGNAMKVQINRPGLDRWRRSMNMLGLVMFAKLPAEGGGHIRSPYAEQYGMLIDPETGRRTTIMLTWNATDPS